MYLALVGKLVRSITYPSGYHNIQKFRVIDMYTRASTSELKERIIAAFATPESLLRVVIATTAFGMSIDCRMTFDRSSTPHVQQIQNPMFKRLVEQHEMANSQRLFYSSEKEESMLKMP